MPLGTIEEDIEGIPDEEDAVPAAPAANTATMAVVAEAITSAVLDAKIKYSY